MTTDLIHCLQKGPYFKDLGGTENFTWGALIWAGITEKPCVHFVWEIFDDKFRISEGFLDAPVLLAPR